MLLTSIDNSVNLIGGVLKTSSITKQGIETLNSFKKVYECLKKLKNKLMKREKEEKLKRE